jgi:hypothetical protein
VTFTPTGLNRRRAQLVVIDSEDSLLSTVPLTGVGIRPHKLILPAEVSFGEVEVGQSATRTITLSNPNELVVSIDGIDSSGPFEVQ